MPERQKAGLWKVTKTFWVPAALTSSSHCRTASSALRTRAGWHPRLGANDVVFAGPQEDKTSTVEIKLVDESVGRKAELLRDGIRAPARLRFWDPPTPHDCQRWGNLPALQPCRTHHSVRGGQLAQQSLVHPLPVGAVENRAALTSPPDNVPAVEHELNPAALDCFHNLVDDPVAALEPEYRPAHSWEAVSHPRRMPR